MFIKRILLNNFRIYKGLHEIVFPKNENQNVTIISGENGYGKTSFLTALVWSLYGKLIIDVDEKFKREVYESGGYRKYANNNLNRIAASNNEKRYSVSITLSDIYIPSIPCNEVEIERTYDCSKDTDIVNVYIDGQINELTKQVGPEIFINDFILPKEIAKFFFFDAEKIVSLAEMKSLEDKRKLSKAYSEVLGVKKYEDLKGNLIDLRIRLRRNLASKKEKERFEDLQVRVRKIERLISFNKEQVSNLSEEKEYKKKQSEQHQEKLIREGNSITIDELLDLKKLKDELINEGKRLRSKMKDFLELAPFAISGKKLDETKKQIINELEVNQKEYTPDVLNSKIELIVEYLRRNTFRNINVDTKLSNAILKDVSFQILQIFGNSKKGENNTYLDLSKEEVNQYDAIFTNLKYSYSQSFKQLIQEEKNNRITLNRVIRKISNAESKEDDLLIKEIRQEKNRIDKRIHEIDNKIADLNQEIGSLQREASVLSRQVSELSKKIELEQMDLAKDREAESLIDELDNFISKLKSSKKIALESRIKSELNSLMHKKDFIHRVEVEVDKEIIDINLFDRQNRIINKESLSKGEQQLYATSILKGLVDESNVEFPIFIDSPLQKFDKKHSKNIIFDFYPNISKQVVLFPLLEKELIEEEYQILLPQVNNCYLIKNINDESSTFKEVEPTELFNAHKQDEYIYAH